MCSGPGTSSLFTFVKKGARNIHVVIFLGQLYVIPVTFGGYTTIHFVLATLHQPIYLKFMEKKSTYFHCPLVCTQPRKWQANRAGTKPPAAQPLASYSKSWGEEEIIKSSLTPVIRWHTEYCQTMGNACPLPEHLSYHKFKFPDTTNTENYSTWPWWQRTHREPAQKTSPLQPNHINMD